MDCFTMELTDGRDLVTKLYEEGVGEESHKLLVRLFENSYPDLFDRVCYYEGKFYDLLSVPKGGYLKPVE